MFVLTNPDCFASRYDDDDMHNATVDIGLRCDVFIYLPCWVDVCVCVCSPYRLVYFFFLFASSRQKRPTPITSCSQSRPTSVDSQPSFLFYIWKCPSTPVFFSCEEGGFRLAQEKRNQSPGCRCRQSPLSCVLMKWKIKSACWDSDCSAGCMCTFVGRKCEYSYKTPAGCLTLESRPSLWPADMCSCELGMSRVRGQAVAVILCGESRFAWWNLNPDSKSWSDKGRLLPP